MSKNTEWNEDSEALEIALKLVEKYPEVFDGIDLQKVKFVRDLSSNSNRIGELKPCGFPYDIDSPFSYYLIINNARWKKMSVAQQNLAVMHLLYGIATNGTDETSANYAKTRKHDVKDYNIILAAAGGNFLWMEPEAVVEDPLSDKPEVSEAVQNALETETP